MSLSVDKMFEYDLGIDYTDTIYDINKRRYELTKRREAPPPVHKPDQCSGKFWGELINTDILRKNKKRTGHFDL